MQTSPDLETLSTTFGALADPTRLAILAQLAGGPATVSELAAPFDISLPAVSRHLKVLESARLIRREKEAQWRRCHLEPEALQQAAGWLEQARRFWDENLESLARYLEDQAPLETPASGSATADTRAKDAHDTEASNDNDRDDP